MVRSGPGATLITPLRLITALRRTSATSSQSQGLFPDLLLYNQGRGRSDALPFHRPTETPVQTDSQVQSRACCCCCCCCCIVSPGLFLDACAEPRVPEPQIHIHTDEVVWSRRLVRCSVKECCRQCCHSAGLPFTLFHSLLLFLVSAVALGWSDM
ncbi:unnamed protein product [Boreogadus saida]